MTQTLSHSTDLVVLTCWCGIGHAVPRSLRDLQLRQHNDGARDVQSVYCPIGHIHVPAGKPQVEREREQRARAEARERHLKDQLEASERSNSALKGQITKAKKRAAAGVCPCCKRTFQNVSRHMAGQHPDFAGEKAVS